MTGSRTFGQRQKRYRMAAVRHFSALLGRTAAREDVLVRRRPESVAVITWCRRLNDEPWRWRLRLCPGRPPTVVGEGSLLAHLRQRHRILQVFRLTDSTARREMCWRTGRQFGGDHWSISSIHSFQR